MIDQNHTVATIDSADFDCVQLGIKPIEVFGHPVVGQALHQAEATVDDGLGCAASLKRNLEFEFSNLLNQITLRLDEMGENFWDNFGVNFGVNFVKNFGNIFWGDILGGILCCASAAQPHRPMFFRRRRCRLVSDLEQKRS